MSSLEYYAMQQVELEQLERRLAQVRLAHELREQRRQNRAALRRLEPRRRVAEIASRVRHPRHAARTA